MSKDSVLKAERAGTNCVKYFKPAISNICGNPDAEPFWVADMDFKSPECVSDAVKANARIGAYGYPVFHETSSVIRQFIEKRHSVSIGENRIVPSHGVLSSLALLTENVPGEFIIMFPAYKPFVRLCINQNRVMHRWDFVYDSETATFSPDFDALRALCGKPEVTLLVLCSPHNPTQHVFTPGELETIADICLENNVTVVSDEIHADLCFKGGKHTLFCEVARAKGLKAATLMAPSKTFNIAGEHFSATIFSDEDDAKTFSKRLDSLFLTSTSYMATTMALSAYTKGLPWIENLVSVLEDNIVYIDSFFKQYVPEIRICMPHSSFVCFADCSALLPLVRKDIEQHPGDYRVTAADSSPLSLFFGIRAGAAFNAGPWFGEGYENFVRINYATDLEHIKPMLERIRKAVEALRD